MIPPIIVAEAQKCAIDIIAITDHNHTANIRAVQKAAEGTGLTVLPGMELQTKEEVHSLCLFDTIKQAEVFQEIINKHLPPIQNNPDFFGEQFVVDPTGDFIRRESQLLIVSCDLSLKEAYQIVLDLGGLFIPAHINRMKFGLLPVLGFVPGDIPLHTLEISRHVTPQQMVDQYPYLKNYQLIRGGDVHFPNEFLGANLFQLKEPTISEIQQALTHQNGRNVTVLG